MISCPKGAIVTWDELRVLVGAMVEAVESVESLIRSEHVPNPKLRTKRDALLERARKKSKREYVSVLRKLDRALMKGPLPPGVRPRAKR